jgi:hypothetical protein
LPSSPLPSLSLCSTSLPSPFFSMLLSWMSSQINYKRSIHILDHGIYMTNLNHNSTCRETTVCAHNLFPKPSLWLLLCTWFEFMF